MLKSSNILLCSARRGRFLLSLIAIASLSFVAVYQLGSLLLMTSTPNYFSDLQPNTYAAFEVDTFNTSMAKLTIIDIVVSDYKRRISIFRRIVNMDREEIFVSEIELLVPENLSQITDTRLLPVDYSKLNYAARPLVSPPFASGSLSYQPKANQQVMIIGLGGSQMNNFLHNAFPLMDITVVELEEEMVTVAKKYFGLHQDRTQRVIVMDGKRYLEEAARKNARYDAIYIDACPTRFPREEQVLCPIGPFLDPEAIKNMRETLKPTGTLVVKMLIFSTNIDQSAENVASLYRQQFKYCTIMPMISNYNRVLVCGGSDMESYQLSNSTLSSGFRKFLEHFSLEPMDYTAVQQQEDEQQQQQQGNQ